MEKIVTTLHNICSESTLRCDFKFIKYIQNKENNDISFRDMFEIISITPEYNTLNDLEDFKYCQIGDVTKEGECVPIKLNFNNYEIENIDYYKKIENGDIQKAENDNILISSVRPNLKKFIRINEYNNDVYFTKAFINLKPKILPKALYYCLKNVFFYDLMSITRQGKGYPTLKCNDLYKLKFDKKIINKLSNIENDLNNLVNNNEYKINAYKNELINKDIIIERHFSSYFNYDQNLLDSIGKGMTNGTQNSNNFMFQKSNVSLDRILKTNNLRLSERSNNDKYNELLNKLLSTKTLQLKDIITEKIHRGVTPEYSEEGISVVKTAHLKNDEVIVSDMEFVSEEFYISNPLCNVNNGDILLASTGKPSIGKIVLYTGEEQLAADGHLSIIRINEHKYNKLFLVYWFRSLLGIFQMERDFYGCTNQIELYENEMKNWRVPDISLDEQRKIVDSIENDFKMYYEQMESINNSRDEINSFITKNIL